MPPVVGSLRQVRGVGCRVFNSAALTLTHNTLTILTFDSETQDSDGFHSTVSNTGRITVPTGFGGWYLVGGCARWAANATGYRWLAVYSNGATIQVAHSHPAMSGVAVDISVSTIIKASAADYFELRALQNSGGDLAVNRQAGFSPEFWAVFLGY